MLTGRKRRKNTRWKDKSWKRKLTTRFIRFYRTTRASNQCWPISQLKIWSGTFKAWAMTRSISCPMCLHQTRMTKILLVSGTRRMDSNNCPSMFSRQSWILNSARNTLSFIIGWRTWKIVSTFSRRPFSRKSPAILRRSCTISSRKNNNNRQSSAISSNRTCQISRSKSKKSSGPRLPPQ